MTPHFFNLLKLSTFPIYWGIYCCPLSTALIAASTSSLKENKTENMRKESHKPPRMLVTFLTDIFFSQPLYTRQLTISQELRDTVCFS